MALLSKDSPSSSFSRPLPRSPFIYYLFWFLPLSLCLFFLLSPFFNLLLTSFIRTALHHVCYSHYTLLFFTGLMCAPFLLIVNWNQPSLARVINTLSQYNLFASIFSSPFSYSNGQVLHRILFLLEFFYRRRECMNERSASRQWVFNWFPPIQGKKGTKWINRFIKESGKKIPLV